MWQWHLCALSSTSQGHPFLDYLAVLGLACFSTAEQPGEPAGFYRHIMGAEQFTGLACEQEPLAIS